MVIAGSALVLAALQACAVYCAWRAIVSARTPQGAVAWVVFLLAAPYLAFRISFWDTTATAAT